MIQNNADFAEIRLSPSIYSFTVELKRIQQNQDCVYIFFATTKYSMNGYVGELGGVHGT